MLSRTLIQTKPCFVITGVNLAMDQSILLSTKGDYTIQASSYQTLGFASGFSIAEGIHLIYLESILVGWCTRNLKLAVVGEEISFFFLSF